MQAIGLAWIAAVSTPTTPYAEFIGAFALSGIGMALFFAPVANVILSSVRPEEEGQASGANNAIRELGGVFGVAVLAAVFAAKGGYGSGQQFVDGMNPAVMIGAALVAVGAIAAFAIKRSPQPEHLAVASEVGYRHGLRLRLMLVRAPQRCRGHRRPRPIVSADPDPRGSSRDAVVSTQSALGALLGTGEPSDQAAGRVRAPGKPDASPRGPGANFAPGARVSGPRPDGGAERLAVAAVSQRLTRGVSQT